VSGQVLLRHDVLDITI